MHRDRSGRGAGRNRLLSALPAAEFDRIAPHLQDFLLKFAEKLYEAGDLIEHVYFPHSGMVSLLTVLDSGDSIETATIAEEGAAGAMTALTDRKAFARVIVRIPGKASRIDAGKFHAIVAGNETLRNLVAIACINLRRQIQQMAACNAVHGISFRLARWLLQSHDYSDGDTLPFTQDFLSQMLGVRRATVTLAARRLQAEGVIDYRHGSIEILNRAGLERHACECYRIIRRQTDALGHKR